MWPSEAIFNGNDGCRLLKCLYIGLYLYMLQGHRKLTFRGKLRFWVTDAVAVMFASVKNFQVDVTQLQMRWRENASLQYNTQERNEGDTTRL